MADRVRGLLKSSSSRLSTKTSMNHMGTTPYRFRIDIFISHADNVKTGSELCVSLERRGKTEATTVITAKDKKVVFRETLTMECTLFRRAQPIKGSQSSKAASGKESGEEILFDEKKAKIYLKKGSASGKTVGKINLNLADYVKSTSSTVFADMKLSDGTKLVTKIEANMIHMGKKKKSGSKAGDSEAGSDMTENDCNSVDDSIFDDEEDLSAVTRDVPLPVNETVSKADSASFSPVSSAEKPPKRNSEYGPSSSRPPPPVAVPPPSPSSGSASTPASASGPAPEIAEKSPSVMKKLFSKTPTSKVKAESENEKALSREKSEKSKSKLKDRSERKKEKEKEKEREREKENVAVEATNAASRKRSIVESHDEVKELRLCLEALKKENDKLKKVNKSAVEEIESLRSDLKTLEETIEESENNPDKGAHMKLIELQKLLKAKEKEIGNLMSHNKNLLEELEDQHTELRTASQNEGEVEELHNKIEDLEIKLQREPEFVEVVSELKVAKLSLALANMEKEEAIFALQQQKHLQKKIFSTVERGEREEREGSHSSDSLV